VTNILSTTEIEIQFHCHGDLDHQK